MGFSNTRHVEKTVEIGVPVSDVWKALTEAEELKCWFPLDAQVTPGPGGSIQIAWRDDFVWSFQVETWEEQKHLRLVYDPEQDFSAYNGPDQNKIPTGPEKAGMPKRLSVDYYLEGKKGSTTLKLVHSGFGIGSNWDQELDSVSRGWNSELISLQHYLECHKGKIRNVAWAKATISESTASAWAKITGPDGLAARGSLNGLRLGDPYEIETVTGDRFAGKVQYMNPPKDFSGSIDNMNHGILRIWIDRVGERTTANLWLSTYGVPENAVQQIEQEWNRVLHDLLT